MPIAAPTDQQQAATFYDRCFSEGYIEDWPSWKKRRVRDHVRRLGLPARGRALDFGCGMGAFTGVLHEALPGWEIDGTDVSAVALASARRRHPGCRFFLPRDRPAAPFDFVFSHHVLEHVPDLDATASELAAYAGERAVMLHVLPCGNEGSLESRLCRSREGAVDPARGNRRFYEDLGHLRRLTSAEAEGVFRRAGFALAGAAFADHFWGAVRWISHSGPGFILKLTDHRKYAAGKLPVVAARASFLALWALCVPSRFPGSPRLRRLPLHRRAVALAAAVPLYPVSKIVASSLVALDGWEWRRRRADPHGSEMYLHFVRAAR